MQNRDLGSGAPGKSFAVKVLSFVCMTVAATIASVLIAQSGGTSEPSTGPAATSTATQKTVSLLAIGNSFSVNAAKFLPEIAEAADCKIVIGKCEIGGCSLEKHWQLVEAFEKNPTSKEGRPYATRTMSLKDTLTSKKWDFVTIQQNSLNSFRPDTYQPFAKNLYDYIKKHAPQAEVLIHETWAYRADDPLFARPSFTAPDMYASLHQAYAALAKELNCRIIPVGSAFENARLDPQWGLKVPEIRFDRSSFKSPELPVQEHSLNVGYRWVKKDAKSEPSLTFDGHHASKAGEYLAGCIWFEFLFGKSVVGNSFVPDGVTPEDAKILQRIAHQTVSEGLRPVTATRPATLPATRPATLPTTRPATLPAEE